MASLPVPLPDVLLEAIATLSDEERETGLCGESATPVQAMHESRMTRLFVSRGLLPAERFERVVWEATSGWRL